MDTSKKKIWILDDDKSIRWVLQKALEKNNYGAGRLIKKARVKKSP